jgi:hypothetical protein
VADGGAAFPKAGPWLGVKETSSAIGDAVRALNVSFEDGRLRRRPGRRILVDTFSGLKVSRIFEHVSLAGERRTVVVLSAADDPTTDVQIGSVDPCGGGYSALGYLGMSATPYDPDGLFWSTSYKGGRSIVSTPPGSMIVIDKDALAPLFAVQGLDAQNLLTASRAYLWGPPPASLVLMWRNRLAALHRRTVGLSATTGDTNVPWDAQASGASVWPASTNFDVLTQEGDEIMGAAVQADRLVCFMRRGVVVVDEDSVSPIPRTADKQYGCVAPRSVVEIGGGLVAYLADRAVCQFNGTSVAPISEDISDTLKLVNWAAAHRAVGVHLAQKQEYRLWLPIRGKSGNRICVIYDYRRKTWRVYSAFYTWTRLPEGAEPFDVTAAAAVLLPSGEEVLLTGDSQGRIWREDVGEDDAGFVFPAYVALAAMRDGAAVEKFSDWRLHAEADGAWVQGVPLEHGDCLEQEISRLVDGLPTDSLTATIRMLDDQAGHVLPTYGSAEWGVDIHTPEERTKRLSWGRANTRSLQPLIILPGQHGGVVDTAPGAIDEIEFAVAPAGGRRG